MGPSCCSGNPGGNRLCARRSCVYRSSVKRNVISIVAALGLALAVVGCGCSAAPQPATGAGDTSFCNAGTPTRYTQAERERATRCLLGAWTSGNRRKAAIVADPPAINALFPQPTRWKWKFAGCEQSFDRPTYLGRYCVIAITPTPAYVEGAAVAIEFYFTAYDDAYVIDEVHFVD